MYSGANMENLTVTTLRLEQKALREIDALAKMEQIDRTTILRQILAVGIREIKIKYALTLYQNGTVSAGKASELCRGCHLGISGYSQGAQYWFQNR